MPLSENFGILFTLRRRVDAFSVAVMMTSLPGDVKLLSIGRTGDASRTVALLTSLPDVDGLLSDLTSATVSLMAGLTSRAAGMTSLRLDDVSLVLLEATGDEVASGAGLNVDDVSGLRNSVKSMRSSFARSRPIDLFSIATEACFFFSDSSTISSQTSFFAVASGVEL